MSHQQQQQEKGTEAIRRITLHVTLLKEYLKKATLSNDII